METRESHETEKLNETGKGAMSESDEGKDVEEKQDERRDEYNEIDFDEEDDTQESSQNETDENDDTEGSDETSEKPVNQILQTPESREANDNDEDSIDDRNESSEDGNDEVSESDNDGEESSSRNDFIESLKVPDYEHPQVDRPTERPSGGFGHETNDTRDERER